MRFWAWGVWIIGLAWAQECGIIYISPTGANSGPAGTRANPASLSYGLSLISPQARYLRLAAGNYSIDAPITLAIDSIIIEGGYLPSQGWKKSNTAITKIIRTAANVEPAPPRLTAIQAIGRRGFRLQDLEIEVAL
jgi:hypothetical protein